MALQAKAPIIIVSFAGTPYNSIVKPLLGAKIGPYIPVSWPSPRPGKLGFYRLKRACKYLQA
jgi:hypothetical protein